MQVKKSRIGSQPDKLFAGFDFSTQGLKAALIDSQAALVYETGLEFDKALPEFHTKGGVHRGADGLTVTSPPLMWIAALDIVLEKMKKDKAPIPRIAAVSGSGQQHGSVYLRKGAEQALGRADPARPLRDQLAGIFAIDCSPVWMDSSTSRQCRERDTALGGPQAVAELTGSRSYERFTGNQIAKIFRETPDAYLASERIALVSSFMASVFAGRYAPIEPGDGAGMNLMDLRARAWAPAALECTAPELKDKLGDIVPSHSVIGNISPYFSARYGFPADCALIAFSGDNPNSLAALRLDRPGDIAISLGTSDTEFGALREPKPSADEGHIFGNPVDPEGYMALICYKNGSLTREHVRDTYAVGSWEKFDAMLASTKPGNSGLMGFYFKEPEITPPVLKPGIFLFDAQGRPSREFTPEQHVRSVLEGQFMSMLLHGRNIGLKPARLMATGGASVNRSILRVMADVFGLPVSVCDISSSASLGAAYRALHGALCRDAGRFVGFGGALEKAPGFTTAAEPDPAAHALYAQMLPRYEKLEKTVVSATGA